MPFVLTQPSALGSDWEYDLTWEKPFESWVGTQTWAQMFDAVNQLTGYDGSVFERVRDQYFVRSRVRLVNIDILTPLLSSLVSCQQGGLLGFHGDTVVQFGDLITVSGVEVPTRGCTIIEETGSGSRGNDNFNKNTRIVGFGGTLKMYDTNFKRLNTVRSDFDWGSDGLVIIRKSTIQMRGSQFNHFYGKMDIDGLEVQTDTGSSVEFRTTPEDFIKFDNVLPYRLDVNENQRVLVMFAPVGVPNNIYLYSIQDFKGVNFARWAVGDGRAVEMINPYFTNLLSVGGTSGRNGHAFEKRTLSLSFSDLDGSPVEGVRCQIQHRADGKEINLPWAFDYDFPYDLNDITNENGELDGLLCRRYWEHMSDRDGTDRHHFFSLTPHIARFFKYGFLPIEQPINANPTRNGQGGFSLGFSMLEDRNITMNKQDALNLAGQVSFDFHETPLSWNGLDWDVTVTTSLNSSQLYQYIRAVQEDGVKFNGDFLPNFLPDPTQTVRGVHGRQIKSFRVIDENESPIFGMQNMESSSRDIYIVPVVLQGSISGFTPNSRIIIYNQTKDTEIFNEIVESNIVNINYVNGDLFSTGDVIQVLHVYYQTDGQYATQKSIINAIAGQNGWSVLISERECQSYTDYCNTYGVTGEDVYQSNEFSYDSESIEINIDAFGVVTDWYAHRMYMWDKYALWHTGNRQYFNKMSAPTPDTIYISDLLLDNISNPLTNYVQKDIIRIVRDDETYPVKNPTTGGGGIDVIWHQPVLRILDSSSEPVNEGQIRSWLRQELAITESRQEIMNEGIKKASKLIPHNEDL